MIYGLVLSTGWWRSERGLATCTCNLAFTLDSTFSYFWDFHRAFTGLGLLSSWACSFSLHLLWISLMRLRFSFSWSLGTFPARRDTHSVCKSLPSFGFSTWATTSYMVFGTYPYGGRVRKRTLVRELVRGLKCLSGGSKSTYFVFQEVYGRLSSCVMCFDYASHLLHSPAFIIPSSRWNDSPAWRLFMQLGMRLGNIVPAGHHAGNWICPLMSPRWRP